MEVLNGANETVLVKRMEKKWSLDEKEGDVMRGGGGGAEGWDEGERCLERGSGVRDWKTEEAAQR